MKGYESFRKNFGLQRHSLNRKKKMQKGWITGETEHSTQPEFEKGLVLQVFQNKPVGTEYYRNGRFTSGSLLLSTGTNALL